MKSDSEVFKEIIDTLRKLQIAIQTLMEMIKSRLQDD